MSIFLPFIRNLFALAYPDDSYLAGSGGDDMCGPVSNLDLMTQYLIFNVVPMNHMLFQQKRMKHNFQAFFE